jgi:hypothetical protein
MTGFRLNIMAVISSHSLGASSLFFFQVRKSLQAQKLPHSLLHPSFISVTAAQEFELVWVNVDVWVIQDQPAWP